MTHETHAVSSPVMGEPEITVLYRPTFRYKFQMVGRKSLANMLNASGLTGMAVEVGTHRGDFADEFLSEWRGEAMWCVDPYLPMYDLDDPAAMGNRPDDRKTAMRKLSRRRNWRGIIEETSLAASVRFTDTSLDFVYVDARHRYRDVLEDLCAWWPKLKRGGVLAGHDIVCPGMEPLGGGWGKEVQPAVMAFAAENSVDVWLLPEKDETGWSFYTFKT